jgi:hypothetical protein
VVATFVCFARVLLCSTTKRDANLPVEFDAQDGGDGDGIEFVRSSPVTSRRRKHKNSARNTTTTTTPR